LPHPPKSFSATGAIFWFKSSAKDSIGKIWELVHWLRLHGHHVEVHKCRHLANIVYEDQYQAAAYPSERDGKTTVQ
jgi:phosphopantothenoylcysteine synthetase/decarboxylase